MKDAYYVTIPELLRDFDSFTIGKRVISRSRTQEARS